MKAKRREGGRAGCGNYLEGNGIHLRGIRMTGMDRGMDGGMDGGMDRGTLGCVQLRGLALRRLDRHGSSEVVPARPCAAS